MKTIITTIIAVVILFLVAETKVSFKPFKVSFDRGLFAIGILFIGIGISMIQYQGYKKGKEDGFYLVINQLKALVNSEQKAHECDARTE